MELHDAIGLRRHSLANGLADAVFFQSPLSESGQMVRNVANQMLVRRAIDAIWNRGDLDVADALFAPDYINHGGLITGSRSWSRRDQD